jgi:hypothetical protein
MSISKTLLFGDCSGEEMVARYWDRMVEKLLQHGGEAAQRPTCDPQIGSVLDRGFLFNGRQVRVQGTPNACHANAAEVWMRHEGAMGLCTGYALTKEGIWLQHSWCVTTGDQGKKLILETTAVDWEKHFGCVLDEQQSFVFAMANIPREKTLRLFAELPLLQEKLKRHFQVEGK